MIAYKVEGLAMLFGAVGPVKPETPEDGEAEREISVTDITKCQIEGIEAARRCKEAGGRPGTCYTIGVMSEVDCLKAKLKEPERK
jgi:hypothetical protein